MTPNQLKRAFLYLFLAMIVACGGLAVLAILYNDSWIWSARIIGSCSIAGAAAILAMGCAATWERRRLHPIGPVALASVVVAATLSIALIWLFDNAIGDMLVQYIAVLDIVAFTLAHVAMLLLARLRSSFEPVLICTAVAAGFCGAICSIMVLAPSVGGDMWQLAMVAGIASATGTLCVVILHLISRVRSADEGGGPVETTTPTTARRTVRLDCPRCAASREAPLGRSVCSCGLGLTITVDEEHCSRCGYLLYGIAGTTCPECGTPRAGAKSPPTASPAPVP